MKKTMFERVTDTKEVKGEKIPVSIIILTQENNGYAVWRDAVSAAVPNLIRFYFDREEAVEAAVSLANSDIVKAELAKTAEAALAAGYPVEESDRA